MMRKITFFLFVICLLLPVTVYANDSDYLFSELADGTICIDQYIGSATEVTVPEEYDGKRITVIGEAAFFNKTRLEKITLPDSITTIEDGAFVNCASLTAFEMPDSVQFLGEYVFARDENLKEIRLSEMLSEIPVQTFYGCTSLTSFTIPEGVKKLGDAAFARCTNLETLEFTATLEYVGRECFASTESMSKLVLPVKTLTEDALKGISASTVVFPEGLTAIESNGFGAASYIDRIDFPTSLQMIADDAMADLTVSEITVSAENSYFCITDDGLYSKDKTTLVKHFSSLLEGQTEITFAPEITRIGAYAFSHFMGMTDAGEFADCLIPSTVTMLGEGCFRIASVGDVTIPDGVQIIPEKAFDHCSLDSISLPPELRRIENCAFQNVSVSNGEFVIPALVDTIAAGAFAASEINCPFLVDEENPSYRMNGRMLYDRSGETLHSFLFSYDDCSDGEVIIPDGTKNIEAKAFQGCIYISALHLPDSVEKIGEKAFYGCMMLQSVSVPDHVTDIDTEAFGYTTPGQSFYDLHIPSFYMTGNVDSAGYFYALENDIAFFTDTPDMNPDTIEMQTGEAILLDIQGALPEQTAYTSSDETIVYIDENGYVRALSAGNAAIVVSSAYINIAYPIHVTGESIADDHVPVIQHTGAEYGFDSSQYSLYTGETADQYGERFDEANQEHSFEVLDNYCIHCYSGVEYLPLLAAQGDQNFAPSVTGKSMWEHDELFKLLSKGLYDELASFESVEDVVLYSGTPDTSFLLGITGSTVADMKTAIGTVVESTNNISTSLAYSVASGFRSENPAGAVLEFYVPADKANGGYISRFSVFPEEYEFLFNPGVHFLVLDAGAYPSLDEETGAESIQQYVKLLVVE